MIRLTLLLVACLGVAMYFADTLPEPAPVAAVEPTGEPSITESIAELLAGTAELESAPAAATAPAPAQTASLDPGQHSIDAPSYLDLFNNPAVVDANGELVITTPVVQTAEPAPAPETSVAAVTQGDDVTVRYVTGERVNVRAGPSTSDPVLDQVVYADAVQVLDETGDGWVHIRMEGAGVEGYMAGRFLQDTDPAR